MIYRHERTFPLDCATLRSTYGPPAGLLHELGAWPMWTEKSTLVADDGHCWPSSWPVSCWVQNVELVQGPDQDTESPASNYFKRSRGWKGHHAWECFIFMHWPSPCHEWRSRSPAWCLLQRDLQGKMHRALNSLHKVVTPWLRSTAELFLIARWSKTRR